MERFLARTPDGALAQFVASVWLYEGPERSHRSERILPTGDTDLVVNLEDDRCSVTGETGETQVLPGVVVAGPFTRPFVLGTDQQQRTLGVIFRTGGAAALLGVPLDELRNRHVALAELWGSGATALRERAVAAPTPPATLDAVEHVLAARLQRTSAPTSPIAAAAARRIVAAPAHCRVAQLADAVGVSTRRLEQVFRAEIGLTPKAYQRLQRFRRALSRIDQAAHLGWARFAVEHGYYDQPHLTQEFQAHSGLTPAAYLAARGPFLNHVALPTSRSQPAR